MALYSICNGMDDVNEQDLCVPSLFSVCLGIGFNTSIWNSPSNQSCFPNKGLRRHRVECLFELVFVLVLQEVLLQVYLLFLILTLSIFKLKSEFLRQGHLLPLPVCTKIQGLAYIVSLFPSFVLAVLTYLHDVISQW